MNFRKSCAKKTTKAIMTGILLLFRYPLMRAYLAVDEIPLEQVNPGSVGTFLRKYSDRFSHCSINFTRTFSKLSHRVVLCFSIILAITAVISLQAVYCSVLAAEYKKKKKNANRLPFHPNRQRISLMF